VNTMQRYFGWMLVLVLTAGILGCAGERTVGTAIDDATITTRVKSALLADPEVKGLDVKVETRDREVLLSGFVDSRAQKQRAVDIARRVNGVKDVIDKMVVKPS
jgi:hyperosmotically inducible protein